MHQWERRKVREVNSLLAAERTAAAAVDVFVVDIVVAAVAVEGDDNWRTGKRVKDAVLIKFNNLQLLIFSHKNMQPEYQKT